MKAMMKLVVCITVLLMCGGCALRSQLERSRSEVVRSFSKGERDGGAVFCIEQANVSTNAICCLRKVYVDNNSFLQTYCIEGRKVFNCRWSGRFVYLTDSATMGEYSNHMHKWKAMLDVLKNLPNQLARNGTQRKPLASGSVITATECWDLFGAPPPDAPEDLFTWSYWSVVRQKTWSSDDAPAEVKIFCQSIAQSVSAPEYARRYRSYLRATPLFTKEALDAEEGTPRMDLEKARYHVHLAVQYPYLLFPVPWGKSPFPAIRKYTPGDKFIVRDGAGEDNPCYYLIETFVGKS